MPKKRRKPAVKSKASNKGRRDLFLRYYNAGNHLQALQFLQSQMKGRVVAPQVLVDATVVCVLLQKWDEAIAYGRKAIKKAPNSVAALDGLSHALWVRGDHDGVAVFGRRALMLRDKMVADVSPTELEMLPNSENGSKKVIAFSLFGGDSKYCETAILNCVEQPDLYPEWECWFYVDDTVPDYVRGRIEGAGGRLIDVSPEVQNWPGPMWRFAAYDDPDVERVIFRDADSVISGREKRAVDEWIQEDKDFHIMRDSGSHTELILAGLWGVKKGALSAMSEMIADFMRKPIANRHFADQYFLREYVWPRARGAMTHHDMFFGFMGGRPFQDGHCTAQQHVGYAEGTPVLNISTSHPDGTHVHWILEDVSSDTPMELCRYPAVVANGGVSANAPTRYAIRVQDGSIRMRLELAN